MLCYAETHEWVSLDGEIATVGITQFAVDQLTDLVYVELPRVGRKLGAKEPFGEVESVKAVSDLYSPVPGEVIETNPLLAVDPKTKQQDAMKIAQDAYGTGWLIKLRVPPGTTLNHLLTLEQYNQQIAEEQH
ncbi:MAG: glycine cleavage system protein GcvH [Planctomycetes bacterium]|nr:glycine cleavage system protein GcvH [Planctomycetota bacterium]